jgi:thiol-disulfide isomerase/thioredoxin
MEVIKFSTTWCAPCKVYAPIFRECSLEQNGVQFTEINPEQNSEAANRYQIKSVPTTIILKNGVEIFRRTGVITKLELNNIINKNK